MKEAVVAMSFNPAETAACEHLARLALAEDLGSAGDLTSQAVLPADLAGAAVFVARSAASSPDCPPPRIVFGTWSIRALSFEPLSRRTAPWSANRTRLAIVRGPMRSVLIGERTALNFMQRLSGIATLTSEHVKLIADLPCKLLDTRKTTPGWRLLEKYAVRQGGGHNHRMGLCDGVLIKDNHLAATADCRLQPNRRRAKRCAWPVRNTAPGCLWRSRSIRSINSTWRCRWPPTSSCWTT